MKTTGTRGYELLGYGLRRRAQEAVGECDCWVAGRPEEERFQIRFGAHCADCPAYRESQDPVDRANDTELCARSCKRLDHHPCG